jgi:hypothetical protein
MILRRLFFAARGLVIAALVWYLIDYYRNMDESQKRCILHTLKQIPHLPERYMA